MADIKNPHDRVFRGSMSDIKVAKPFLTFYLADEAKQDLDLSTLELLPTSHVNTRLDESISDLVYSCKYKDVEKGEARIIILVEHQSTPDRFMPVRVYDYIFGIWRNELKYRQVDNHALLPACHALVFYHGEQKPYPYSMDLAACIHDPKERMTSFWQNTIQLVEVDDYSDERLLEQKLDGVLSLALKHSRDKDLTDLIYQIAKRLAVIDTYEQVELEFIKRLMFYLFNTKGNIDKPILMAKFERIDSPIGGKVMTFAEQLRAEGREEGRAEGRAEGREEGADIEKTNMVIKCLKEGAAIDFIAKVTELSVKRINAIAKEHQLH